MSSIVEKIKCLDTPARVRLVFLALILVWCTYLSAGYAYEFSVADNMRGAFLYKDKPLVLYRIHDQATSKMFIDNQKRVVEDRIMFSKFYPPVMVDIIMHFYKLAYKTY